MNSSYRSVMARVLDQLIDTYDTLALERPRCYHCDNSADDEYATKIFWCSFHFCSGKCQWEAEHDIRRSYMRAMRRRNAVNDKQI
jgi:hypothetical protein